MKVRTEARREAILDVARQVFLEAGFERASMSEITRQVGGSKATLYGYFPSKEALFFFRDPGRGRAPDGEHRQRVSDRNDRPG